VPENFPDCGPRDNVVVASCPAGAVLTGGGFDATSGIQVRSSRPLVVDGVNANAWEVRYLGSAPGNVTSYAVCAPGG
jgi:hypothetical protein